MKKIRKSQDEIKDLRKRITEFKENLEFTENELHGKIKNLEEKHESIKKPLIKSTISKWILILSMTN